MIVCAGRLFSDFYGSWFFRPLVADSVRGLVKSCGVEELKSASLHP